MIRKVYLPEGFKASDIPELFAEEHIQFETIDICNWPDKYPYKPTVEFALAHTGKNILIDYRVVEKTSRAAAGEDFGKVWEDSCVEFFSSPDGKVYYNLECNCIGKVLLAKGESRNIDDPTHIVAITPKPFYQLSDNPRERTATYLVTALNPVQNESKAKKKKVKF